MVTKEKFQAHYFFRRLKNIDLHMMETDRLQLRNLSDHLEFIHGLIQDLSDEYEAVMIHGESEGWPVHKKFRSYLETLKSYHQEETKKDTGTIPGN